MATQNVARRLSELADEPGQQAADEIELAQENLQDVREELEKRLYNLGLTENDSERLSYTELGLRRNNV
jgi:adenylate cyclase class IV